MCIRVQLGLEWLDDIASWIFRQRKKRIARNWWKRRVWTGWEIKKIIQNHRWSAAQHLYVKSMAKFPNLQINYKKKKDKNKQTNKLVIRFYGNRKGLIQAKCNSPNIFIRKLMKPGFKSILEIPFSVMTKDLSFRLWVMAISLSVVASLTAKTTFPTCLLQSIIPWGP